MNARLVPSHIATIGEELCIAWQDGVENFFSFEVLRRNCPCAVCQGEADVMGTVERPERIFTPGSFSLKTVRNVGGYALQPLWADGHETGLYSYNYLRELGSRLSNATP